VETEEEDESSENSKDSNNNDVNYKDDDIEKDEDNNGDEDDEKDKGSDISSSPHVETDDVYVDVPANKRVKKCHHFVHHWFRFLS
jgi:hypothetical protein